MKMNFVSNRPLSQKVGEKKKETFSAPQHLLHRIEGGGRASRPGILSWRKGKKRSHLVPLLVSEKIKHSRAVSSYCVKGGKRSIISGAMFGATKRDSEKPNARHPQPRKTNFLHRGKTVRQPSAERKEGEGGLSLPLFFPRSLKRKRYRGVTFPKGRERDLCPHQTLCFIGGGKEKKKEPVPSNRRKMNWKYYGGKSR